MLERYVSPLTAAADHYVSKGPHYVPEQERREFSRVEKFEPAGSINGRMTHVQILDKCLGLTFAMQRLSATFVGGDDNLVIPSKS